MGYSKPQVTIDLEEYQYLLKIKEDGHDDAAINVINQTLKTLKDPHLVSRIGADRVLRTVIEQYDVTTKEINDQRVIVKISNRK